MTRCRSIILLVGILVASIAAVSHPGQPSPKTLRQRTRNLALVGYIHGMPFDQARALGSEAIPYLREILEDSSSERFWGNAVTAVGDIGSKKSLGVLTHFIWHRFRGPVSDDALRSLLAAQGAIGRIPPDVDPAVEEYLWKGADPTYWSALPWWYDRDRGPSINVLLSRLSIDGLGWMGTKRSAERLEALARKPFHAQQRVTISVALKRSRGIRAMGRETYFRFLNEVAQRNKRPFPPTPRFP